MSGNTLIETTVCSTIIVPILMKIYRHYKTIDMILTSIQNYEQIIECLYIDLHTLDQKIKALIYDHFSHRYQNQ